MLIHQINPAISVADQIEEGDVAALAAAGFKTVVGNRPDDEGGTPMASIEAACQRQGLTFYRLPVQFSTLSLNDAEQFERILRQTEAPLLAYCRSGRRSAALWALAMAPYTSVRSLLERSSKAGIPLHDLRPLLDQSAMRQPAVPGSSTDFAQRWLQEG
jgi:uncharacterized protein (TIGR01244 family)